MLNKDRNTDHLICEQTKVLSELLCLIHDQVVWFRSMHGLATKKDLQEAKEEIMASLAEQGKAIKGYFERVNTGIDGIAADQQKLTDKINELQNSPGAITAEDQALLDEIQTLGEAVASRVEALDALTPPPVPS